MSDTLALATRLRAIADPQLAEIIRARTIAANGIKDFFDLAEAFLDRASIQQALSRCDRETLAVLMVISQSTSGEMNATVVEDRLSAFMSPSSLAQRVSMARELLLLEPTEPGSRQEPTADVFTAYGAVSDQLSAWPGLGLPSLADLLSTPAPKPELTESSSDDQFLDRIGAEHAFAVTAALTQLLVEVEKEPARELAKGGIALPDTKRLAATMAIEADAVALYLLLAGHAGLIARDAGFSLITEAGTSWLLESTVARWGALATSWLDRLPPDIRTLLGERVTSRWGTGLRSYIDWLYPAGGAWMDARVAEYTRDADLLGITADQSATTAGSLLLSSGVTAAQTALAEHLPTEVEQVYLQHDLSIVAPGPLTPRVDARLRALADVESRALASSYRVSTASINRAMSSGETAESLLEFLRSISLTGIPQPLDYLISEASARYGLVRVGNTVDGTALDPARTYIRSEDSYQISTILVDQGLTSLGLERTADGRAVSRFPLDVVFWSVSDARYPVAAENAAGEIISLPRQHTARSVAAPVIDPVVALIERLRVGSAEQREDETGQAWLVRQLDVAIKAKASLTISISMPNGSVVDYQLEPTSVTGGRLRGRDNRSAIERTLPLSRIAAIGPAT